jgi:hypothetical protein
MKKVFLVDSSSSSNFRVMSQIAQMKIMNENDYYYIVVISFPVKGRPSPQ